MDIYKQRDLCGDLIISGHTICLVVSYLAVKQYSPRRVAPFLSFLMGMCVAVGMVCILLARRHYCVDVLLAYFLSTRVFWMYHALVADPNSALNQVWWHPILKYFETDAPAPSLWHNRFQCPSGCFGVRSWQSRNFFFVLSLKCICRTFAVQPKHRCEIVSMFGIFLNMA